MSGELTTNDLSKSAGNLLRIEQFFSCRISWRVDSEANTALLEMQQATSGLIDTIGGLLQANGIRFAERKRPEQSAQEPPGDLEAIRLQRFTAYLRQLGQWFHGHSANEVPRQGYEILRAMHCSLCTAGRAMQLIFEHNLAPSERPAPQPMPPPAPRPPIRVIEDKKKARLEMVNSTERPLLVSFKGSSELSSDAREMIASFLAENKISIGDSQLRQYLAKVVRWIEAIPDGQALVLKVSPVQDEPYPSYARRSEPRPQA